MTLNITVFGGHGFIGRHVVQRLAKRGDLIRVAARRPESGHFLKPLGNVGQIVPIQANVRDELSIKKAVSGADAVINLVGILREQGRQTFKDVHERAPRLIASAAAESGVKHFVHLSAIGADTKSPSLYGKSKALGELALFEAFPTATILRPSIIFGPDDEFFNKMAALIAILPFVPIFFDTFKFPKISFNGIFPNIDFNAGITNFQPVYVGDVADSVIAALSKNAEGKIFELGGPNQYSYRDLMLMLLHETGINRPLLPVPFLPIQLAALFLERIPEFFLKPLPLPPLSRDQIRMLRVDNIVSKNSLGLSDLGIRAQAVESIIPTYISSRKKNRG